MARPFPAVLAAALLAPAGCALFTAPERKDIRETPPKAGMTVAELDQLTKNLAHRYVQLLADACDRLKEGAARPELKRLAHRLKLEDASAAYDMVTGPDPIWQLVNLAALIELENLVWGDEGGARRAFGPEGGALLAGALASARKDLWGVASQVLTPPELESVRNAIHDWRKGNPDVRWVSRIRFDVIAQLQEQTRVGQAGTLTAVLGKFNPSEGREQADTEARQLVGQAFFYFKQLPTILRWHAEGALDEAVATAESFSTFEALEETLKTAGRALERVTGPAAGEGLALDPTLRELRLALEAGRDLAAEARQAVQALRPEPDRDGDSLPDPADPDAKPFDIDRYRAALHGAARAAREATALVREARGLAESEAASRRLGQALGGATERGRELVDHLTWRAVQVVLLVALLVAAGLAARFALRRRSARPKPPASA